METRGDQALSKVFKPLCGDKERYRDKDDREDRAQRHSLEYMRLHDLFAYSEADWSLLHKQYTEDLMALRPGSPEFIGALKELGVASTSEVVNRA